MNATASAVLRKPLHWPLLVMLLPVAVGIAWFVGARLHYYVDISPESLSPYFWPRRFGFVPHVFGGLVAICAGLAQVWLGLSSRTGPLHRALGRVYVAAVAVGGLGGLYLAVTISNGLVYRTGLFLLSIAWLLTTSMALWSVRNRRMQQHRDWMLRSYVVTLAFLIFRLGERVLLWALDVPPNDPVETEIIALMAWACWAVPLLLAEPLIQLRAVRNVLPAKR